MVTFFSRKVSFEAANSGPTSNKVTREFFTRDALRACRGPVALLLVALFFINAFFRASRWLCSLCFLSRSKWTVPSISTFRTFS